MSSDSASGLRVYVWAMGALALVAGGGLIYHASGARQIEEQLPGMAAAGLLYPILEMKPYLVEPTDPKPLPSPHE
ncbi:MAG: hypothetical protein L0216_10440, partial [Planctomycetales bacterium]|nr:hypothetical protein [Planctomycetales bacterium]